MSPDGRAGRPFFPLVFNGFFALLWYRDTHAVNHPLLLLQVVATTGVAVALAHTALARLLHKPGNVGLQLTLTLGCAWLFAPLSQHLGAALEALHFAETPRPRTVVCVGLAGVAAWLIRRPDVGRETRRNLNLTALALCGVTAVEIAALPPLVSIPIPAQLNLASRPAAPELGPPPDIYYLVMDSHTSFASLRQHWGYDAQVFKSFLIERGFVVLDAAKANLNMTVWSIATTLTSTLPHVPAGLTASQSLAMARRAIAIAEPLNFLRHQGYEMVNLSPFDVPGSPRFFSIPIIPEAPSLRSLLSFNFGSGGLDRLTDSVPAVHGALLKRLAQSDPSRARPRFVYAHYLVPHFPYRFDRDGRPVTPPKPRQDAAAYLEQLRFAESLAQEAISAILRSSPRPPIIILQGDHGSRALAGFEGHRETFQCLHALLLPNGGGQKLKEGFTPVNTLRLVLNHYFLFSLDTERNAQFVMDAGVPREIDWGTPATPTVSPPSIAEPSRQP